jgi:hypothetical protein
MGSILSVLVSLFAFRFRSRGSLEIELIAVRHQLAVLRDNGPAGLRLVARPAPVVHDAGLRLRLTPPYTAASHAYCLT